MNAAYTYKRLSKDEAVALLVDHQAGLISMVQDYPPGEFKNNVLALANIAKFFKLPTILTTGSLWSVSCTATGGMTLKDWVISSPSIFRRIKI